MILKTLRRNKYSRLLSWNYSTYVPVWTLPVSNNHIFCRVAPILSINNFIHITCCRLNTFGTRIKLNLASIRLTVLTSCTCTYLSYCAKSARLYHFFCMSWFFKLHFFSSFVLKLSQSVRLVQRNRLILSRLRNLQCVIRTPQWSEHNARLLIVRREQ